MKFIFIAVSALATLIIYCIFGDDVTTKVWYPITKHIESMCSQCNLFIKFTGFGDRYRQLQFQMV